ncbi:hypothetical protein QBC34DRAFT_457748 [Podospora aff. communis PSN243]|uniref:Uncharacterized protein n=1 Tax=Podospora aff. communis PSN243 TaxID=3040156 RepID=A0AAV9GVS0_9PEZI|nr:hypothetical protein QBC34DRAFT_457748 [Podospora aff. communis PSN243]
MDIAARRAASPRVIRLDTIGAGGKSWVDLVKSLKAVTLFGKGFGELLEPVPSAANKCSLWRTLPKEREYLAVSSYDLSRILHQEGDAEACPAKLAPGVFWDPSELFGPCACMDPKRKSCDPAQSLLSEPLFKRTLKKSTPTINPCDLLGNTSAIVFGRNSLFGYVKRLAGRYAT